MFLEVWLEDIFFLLAYICGGNTVFKGLGTLYGPYVNLIFWIFYRLSTFIRSLYLNSVFMGLWLFNWLYALLTIFYLFYNNCFLDANKLMSLLIGDLLAMLAVSDANLEFLIVPLGLTAVFLIPSSRGDIINS